MSTLGVMLNVPQKAEAPLWNKRLFLVANADVVASQVYPESVRLGRWEFMAMEEPGACDIEEPHQHFAARAPGESGPLLSEMARSEIKAVLTAPPGRGLWWRRWVIDRLIGWVGAAAHSWPLAWLGILATYSDGNGHVLCPTCEEWIPTSLHRH